MAHQEKVRHCYQGIYGAPLGGAPLIYQFLFMFILVFYFSVFLFLLKFANIIWKCKHFSNSQKLLNLLIFFELMNISKFHGHFLNSWIFFQIWWYFFIFINVLPIHKWMPLKNQKKLLMAHQEKVRHCYQGTYGALLGGAPLVYQFLFRFILILNF